MVTVSIGAFLIIKDDHGRLVTLRFDSHHDMVTFVGRAALKYVEISSAPEATDWSDYGYVTIIKWCRSERGWSLFECKMFCDNIIRR